MDNGKLDNIIMALLFSADEPVTVRKISSILESTDSSDIHESISRWQKRFDDESWSIVLEKVAGGYQLSTRSEYGPYIARLYSGRRKLRLSKAALETMAIIAYKQPITRAEIENIRGVGCGSVISNLMERSLIRITGKAKVLGAPFLYGTTQEFLEYLGLNSLRDLPSLEELEALLEREEGAAEDSEAGAPDAPGESGAAAAAAEPQSPGTARLGPDIEEPYHRPLGDEGDDPSWRKAETTAESEETGGEEPRRDDRADNRDD